MNVSLCESCINSEASEALHINYNVIRGSALGPVMFIISTSDLKAVTPGNLLVKYADDVTMVVPASNSASIPVELASVDAWSAKNNQFQNVAKTAELVISCRWARNIHISPPIPEMARLETILLLGVVLD